MCRPQPVWRADTVSHWSGTSVICDRLLCQVNSACLPWPVINATVNARNRPIIRSRIQRIADAARPESGVDANLRVGVTASGEDPLP